MDEEEVDGDGDGKDRSGRPCLRYAQPEEEVEQADVEQVVDQMGSAETAGTTPRGARLFTLSSVRRSKTFIPDNHYLFALKIVWGFVVGHKNWNFLIGKVR